MPESHIHDLALILEDLEAQGRLARVTSEVDPALDLAGIAAEFEGKPRALMFDKVKGHPWPVVTGLYWSRELLAALMRKEERALPQYVSGCIKNWQTRPVHPEVVSDGPVLEVTENDVDLTKMPIPVHATKDGGAYFDAGVVIAKDPETDVRNASIQRFQVANKNTLHINIDSGRHLEDYLAKAAKQGRSLTFTLNCGVGPGLHFAASAPAEAAPIEKDELGIASEFHGRPLELVHASNGYDDIVADAMWALECEMVPGEVANEGPFAEVTGYYATVAPRPVVHVKKIHRRSEPVFQTILSGMEVYNSVGLLGEANVLNLLQQQVPGVTDAYFSHGGCGFYHCVVAIKQPRAGWSKQAIMAAFAAFPPLKMVTVVDDDVDIRNAQDVEWALATRMDPSHGVVVVDQAFGHGLNPSFPDYFGAKVGFDATQPHPRQPQYERATFKKVSLADYAVHEPEIVIAKAEEAPAAEMPTGPKWNDPAERVGRTLARLQRRHTETRRMSIGVPGLADVSKLGSGGLERIPAPVAEPTPVQAEAPALADSVTPPAPKTNGAAPLTPGTNAPITHMRPVDVARARMARSLAMPQFPTRPKPMEPDQPASGASAENDDEDRPGSSA
jgi:2,5-furandicarboxylate decarboxylase 1